MKVNFVIVVSTLLAAACSTNNRVITDNTVKITNMSENSGGSGSIVSHSPYRSEILTNAHVCGVAKNGGIIETNLYQKAIVQSYKVSKLHDLCLIEVKEDLHTSASLSIFPPFRYESVQVSGHPHLLPTIITDGYFSDKMVIQIMVGIRACTEHEAADPKFMLPCLILGGLPVVRSYDSIVISSLIQPGSSGSGVYTDGKISAVVFAGSGDIGFGMAVPYEYVYAFLNDEVTRLDTQYPNMENTDAGASEDKKREWAKKAKDFCDNKILVGDICDLFKVVTHYNDLIERE